MHMEKESPKQGELLTDEQKAYTLQRLEAAYFNALVEGFEATDKPSTDPLDRAGKELKKVKKLIKGKFQRCTTGAVYSNLSDVDYSKLPGGKPPSIWLFYRNDGRPEKNIAYWYDRICVDGIDGGRYVRTYHAEMSANSLNSHHPEDLYFVVSALAFHRFKGYLEAKAKPGDSIDADVSETIAPSFQSLFLSDESMERALEVAEKVKMIHRNGEVIIWTKKWNIGSIAIFWEHLSGMNPPMVDTSIDYRIAADVIAEKFGKSISDRAKRGTPKYRDEIKNALKVALG